MRPVAGVAIALLLLLIAASLCGYGLWNSSSTTPVYTARISRGVLSFKYFGDTKGALIFQPVLQSGWRFGWAKDELNPVWRWLPEWQDYPGPYRQLVLRIPLWIPVAVLMAPFVWSWWRAKRTEAAAPCPKCGYDLVGLAGAKCPECGAEVEG